MRLSRNVGIFGCLLTVLSFAAMGCGSELAEAVTEGAADFVGSAVGSLLNTVFPINGSGG